MERQELFDAIRIGCLPETFVKEYPAQAELISKVPFTFALFLCKTVRDQFEFRCIFESLSSVLERANRTLSMTL